MGRRQVMDGLIGRVADILRSSHILAYKELAKRILDEVWSSDEFMDRAKAYCQELGWRSQ